MMGGAGGERGVQANCMHVCSGCSVFSCHPERWIILIHTCSVSVPRWSQIEVNSGVHPQPGAGRSPIKPHRDMKRRCLEI